MRVLFAADHAGVDLKQLLVERAADSGHDPVDLGTDGHSSVDYTDFAHDLARRIAVGEAPLGVLICGTGIGMSITANRHAGVRAAVCHDAFTTEMARRHNNANVLCLGGRTTGPGVAIQMLEIFLGTSFDGGRHEGRVERMELSPGTGDLGPGTEPPSQPNTKENQG